MRQRSNRHATFFAIVVAVVVAGGLVSAGPRQQMPGDQSPADGDGVDHRTFSFALWGDTPYSDAEKTAIPALIEDINRSGVKFSIFGGDIKSGSSLCSNAVYAEAIARFNTFLDPMVYVPGDNEWTDCHRKNNGSFNPFERLDYIRNQMVLQYPGGFGEKTLDLEHQDAGPVAGTTYPENTRWTHGGVVFLGLNVPGSNNNLVHTGQCLSSKSLRTQADCDADNLEYAARDAANNRFLAESFDLAMSSHARGLVVVMQADPSFDLPETETDNERTCVRAASGECVDPPLNTNRNLANYDGYDAFLALLRARTVEFGTIGGEVLLVHGDTHFYKVDMPLDGPTSLLPNFTRVGTFGSPSVHWVKVTVNSHGRNLFTFEPMIVKP